jgi:hypothetical protein
MNQFSPFKIIVSAQIPSQEREFLLLLIQDKANVQTPENRAFGIDDYILIVGGIAATAEMIKAVGELAEKIIEWREHLRQKSIEPQAKLEKSGKNLLDLKSATDEEVREWFNQ